LFTKIFFGKIEVLLYFWGGGGGDVATHGIYSIDDDLCDDLEGGGSNGYEEGV